MILQLDLTKQYSYADYLTWFDDARRELIDGFIRLMSPAPNKIHQVLSSRLHILIGQYLWKKQCKVFHAPFDVRLPKNGEKNDKDLFTVVQPDLCIICDPEKLDERGCLGAPDMIIEILSMNNSKHDIQTKYNLYQQHGVKEYWIVYPYEKVVHTYWLGNDGTYSSNGVYAQDDKVPVAVFNDDLIVDLVDVFEDI